MWDTNGWDLPTSQHWSASGARLFAGLSMIAALAGLPLLIGALDGAIPVRVAVSFLIGGAAGFVFYSGLGLVIDCAVYAARSAHHHAPVPEAKPAPAQPEVTQ